MCAAVVWDKRGPAVSPCKAHSGTQSTSRNNSRNQKSEFLLLFLITKNSNHFKTTGRELLRPMTHQQPLSGQAVCLGGERLLNPSSTESCSIQPGEAPCPSATGSAHPWAISLPHSAIAVPRGAGSASPDLTPLRSDGAEPAPCLERVPKTPTSPWFLGQGRARTDRSHAPNDGPACTVVDF